MSQKRLDDGRLARIRTRLNNATQGPWHSVAVAADEGNVCIRHTHYDLFRYEPHYESTRQEPGLTEGTLSHREVNVGCYLGDADDAIFIANARADVEALLREVDRLRVQDTGSHP